MKDHEIIDLFFERSEQAIADLDRKYGAAVRGVSAGILRDRQDVEECVNDTYLRVWSLIPPQRPEHLGAFCCRIARNVSLDRCDFNSADKRSSRYGAALDELAGCVPDAATVESEVDARELATAIDRFLEGLSRDDRCMFMQRYWRGAAVADVARQMGLTAHAVSVRLFRIRRKLKDHLMKEGIIA